MAGITGSLHRAVMAGVIDGLNAGAGRAEEVSVENLYDNCVGEDVFFDGVLTKDSIWQDCFGQLCDDLGQINICCIARIYDRSAV